ncbi:phosphate ABC transporter permease PstA [Ectothiorhodospiraceae bacterium BW-2]|nr:phosphate ABC transporter permease PstA [Ectothiorhodospiraceae bacterium BW-2]
MKDWYKSGSPWIWLNAGAVSISVVMVVSLLILITVRGMGHFWPKEVLEYQYPNAQGTSIRLIGETHDSETVPMRQITINAEDPDQMVERRLIKIGNREANGLDFRWIVVDEVESVKKPESLMVLERHEWGNFYGFLESIEEQGETITPAGGNLWGELQTRLERVTLLHEQIKVIERDDIGAINYQLEELRLAERRLELDKEPKGSQAYQKIAAERVKLDEAYKVLQQQLNELYRESERDSLTATIMDGTTVTLSLAKIVRAYMPNSMTFGDKVGFYFAKLGEFIFGEPREANTEGGIFPAIFGTVLMVLLMAVIVTPFGVVAAVYLREYATQGPLTRLIRIAVNNLAGVPSIVYGVFGLGFFVYFLGGSIDALFYPEALPSPTFGTPGLLWSSLTLAILTLPVVIVSTEEGLSRIPQQIREGSLALGATKIETLWRTIIPMASPAMMTGLILAVARAAGEVAPLMLVGVVKLAPTLPLDGNFPFLHLDRKFMHLGFHIYDVGFQSPNVEAARPLVYATALLLVLVIILLNISAIHIRNHLREKYRALEH